jgi:hypothetical protein
MLFVIYTLCWLAFCLVSCVFSFFLGRLPVIDSSSLPWIVHRSYEPDPSNHDRPASSDYRNQQPSTSPPHGPC